MINAKAIKKKGLDQKRREGRKGKKNKVEVEDALGKSIVGTDTHTHAFPFSPLFPPPPFSPPFNPYMPKEKGFIILGYIIIYRYDVFFSLGIDVRGWTVE